MQLSPQQKIDLIDLTRYAYEKKYIRRWTEMKMKDPVRKLIQRILSKMFKGANITKNRGRGAYNVSFVSDRKYHGDRPQNNYFGDNHLQPGHIGGLHDTTYMLSRDMDQNFFPHVEYQAHIHQRRWGQHYYRYNNKDWHYQGTPLESWNEEQVKAFKVDMTYLRKLCYKFLQLYRSNFLYEHMDARLAAFINGNEKVFQEQDYGFSIAYKILSCGPWDHYYHSRLSHTKKPIVRRFHKDSPIIKKLEAMVEAYKVFKKISKVSQGYQKLLITSIDLTGQVKRSTGQAGANYLTLLHDENPSLAVNCRLDEIFGTKFFEEETKIAMKRFNKHIQQGEEFIISHTTIQGNTTITTTTDGGTGSAGVISWTTTGN